MRLRRLAVPLIGLALIGGGTLAFGDLNDNLVYYLTPREAIEQRDDLGETRFRLAGEVVTGSLEETAEGALFEVGEGDRRLTVDHTGTPPQLFREGIDAVVEGHWAGGRFVSEVIIVKHDEEYEAADPSAEGRP